MKQTNAIITLRTQAEFKAKIIAASIKAGTTMTAYMMAATRVQLAKDVEISVLEGKSN